MKAQASIIIDIQVIFDNFMIFAFSMAHHSTTNQLRSFASRLLQPVVGQVNWTGDIFLCGGAFKSAIRPNLPVKDLDLWVRNRKDRERLRNALLEAGCSLKKDFAPFCIAFEKQGQAIEITYQNVNDRPLSFLLNSSDLGICSIGVQWTQGEIVAMEVSECFDRSVRDQIVYLNDCFRQSLAAAAPISVLRTIDRMECAAAELGFGVSPGDVEQLWNCYQGMSQPEKRDAVEQYLLTTVGYKGRSNAGVMRRACSLLSRREPELLVLAS